MGLAGGGRVLRHPGSRLRQAFPGKRIERGETRDPEVPDGSIPIRRTGAHHWESEPIPDADFHSFVSSGIGWRVEGEGEATLSHADFALAPTEEGWVLEGVFEVEQLSGSPVLEILGIRLDGIVYSEE